MKSRSMIIYYPIFPFMCIVVVIGLKLPGECDPEQYYDPGSMDCQSCPANVSMVTSDDGFGCKCEDHSVPVSQIRCRPCNATEVVSDDGASCVPRRCLATSGKIVCRKCPNDYVSVTQGHDGSPLKEVLCVKCARGFRAQDNRCVKCEACVCNRQEVVVRGICVPRKYVTDRPEYTDSVLHPTALLEIVKEEYLCTKNNLRACRTLGRLCVKSFYLADAAGPCRLWLQPQLLTHKGLPQLTIAATDKNIIGEEIELSSGQNKVVIVMMIHTKSGGLKLLRVGENISPCLPPLDVRITEDITRECPMNVSKPNIDADEVYELYLYHNDDFKPIPLSILKPTGHYVSQGAWSSSKFKKFFVLDTTLSTTANMTDVIYLKYFTLLIRLERSKHIAGSLHFHLSVSLQYGTKSPLPDTVTTTLRVVHDMPLAGVLRGLEICCGILAPLCVVYAVVRWRAVVHRGGPQLAGVPMLAGAAADAIYFSVLLSTVHALSAEAGTLGLSLPLSRAEENVIQALVYTVVALKIIKVLWINWCHYRCDIFFIDWSEYDPSLKEKPVLETSESWREACLAREWSRLQTTRHVSPAHTAAIALLVLQLMSPWQSSVPKSQGYKWAIGMVGWWTAYTAVLLARWLHDKMVGPPTDIIPKVCSGVGLSLLVFEEDLYAHYVHGRYEASSDFKSMTGPLAKCRVVCAPQLRAVYKKLSSPEYGNISNTESNRILLSRFLAAFFERALDGLNWVGSERSVLERLVDAEMRTREGATSALLYDPGSCTPSCFAVTWWGEEWTLATFDTMLFGCVFLATDQFVFAALATLIIWQIMKQLRTWLGNKTIREKTQVEI